MNLTTTFATQQTQSEADPFNCMQDWQQKASIICILIYFIGLITSLYYFAKTIYRSQNNKKQKNSFTYSIF